MITRKTVLVLGAGASVVYGYPTADVLRNEIVNSLRKPIPKKINTNFPHGKATEALVGLHGRTKLEKFRDDFFYSQQPSIDRFVENRLEDYEDLGREVIAAFLIPCEDPDFVESVEFRSERDDTDHWYKYLFHRMGPTIRDFEKSVKSLSIITFNYDRSLEYYLYHALLASYEISETRAAALIDELSILHMYGVLGECGFSNTSAFRRNYGPSMDKLEDTARMLRISRSRPENVEGAGVISAEVYEIMESAETVCFVGFGYDLTNLSKIGLSAIRECERGAECKIRGTKWNLPVDVYKRAVDHIGRAVSRRGKWSVSLGGLEESPRPYLDDDMVISAYLREHLILG